MIFFISLLLMAWVSLRWATRLASSLADGYWIFVACVMLQVGAITSLTSLVHQLTPWMWVLIQVLIGAVTLPLTGGVRRPAGHRLLGGWHRLSSRLNVFFAGLSLWGVIALCVICGLVGVSMVLQAVAPIQNFDDRMYHASRVIYWIQHQTVFPYDTHNIRQTLVPFGSELFFLWPVLLTKTEAVGRLVFGLAFPLVSIGQYFLLRALKLNQTAALVGVLILISTPLVVSSSMGLKPEIWAAVALLGVAYWAVTLCSGAEGLKTRCFFLGVFTVLSINIRPFPVSLLPSLLLILWWASGDFSFVARLKAFVAGLVLSALLSSLLIPLAFNTALYRHPLGPEEVQRVVKAEITPQLIYTHAVRFAFLLLELPDVPASTETRSLLSGGANQLISAVGAGEPLAGEDDRPWPGKFVYSLPEHAARFSLWGLLWILVLLVAVPRLIHNVVSTWPHVRLTAVSAQTLLAVPLLGAVLFGSRWMVHSEVPGRFLVGPYSLALPLGIALVVSHLSAKKFAQAIVAMAVVYAVYTPVRERVFDAGQAIAAPASGKVLNEPFDEIVGSVMPAGSRVLFVGNQDSRDYPLFSPETHYSNTVIPWGIGRFDPAAMDRLIASNKVSHVLIEHDERLKFMWFPTLDTREMVKWLNADAGLKAVPLRAPHMRLYEVMGATSMNERAFNITATPPGAPLISIADPLKTQVGIDPVVLESPWPIESLGGGGFLWVGQGHGEGLEFGLWSRQAIDVNLRFKVSPGPGLTAPGRKVVVLHDGMPVGDEHSFQGEASMVLRTRLKAGRNIISFFAVDGATVNPQPNGDTRNLVVGLHQVRVESAPMAATEGARPDSPTQGEANGLQNGNGDLAQSARQAVGLIARRQQADGYWLTPYTSGVRFEGATLEMNTYVTSLMVDVLGSTRDPLGLGGSLERARAHLRDQIEANGLVRYHGRPGARAMSAHGLCTITPDADDTALAWRIAPGADALRSSALETLTRYRTAEGLYKTWLGQQHEYQCLNPGADPNPTDVGIQMHLLMWLAQVDPPAARSLCTALRNTIDQDRLWVYYKSAPLVPVMRQADLKAAGCDVPLPPSRARTAVDGQDIWLDAGQMLQRLQGGKDQAPTSAEVVHLLRALSKDDFSPVRLNPPLLYHNDLSASVRRYYWSEDVGHAIWLRLYLDSVRLGLLPAPEKDGPAGVGQAGGRAP